MLVKQHITRDKRLILAVCDSELKGKCFEDKKFRLDLSSDFYNGKELTDEETIKLMKIAYIVNIVGKKAIQLGIKVGIIDKDQIIDIKGVPHAQGIVITED